VEWPVNTSDTSNLAGAPDGKVAGGQGLAAPFLAVRKLRRGMLFLEQEGLLRGAPHIRAGRGLF
jgi:hypothetical protein